MLAIVITTLKVVRTIYVKNLKEIEKNILGKDVYCLGIVLRCSERLF